MKKLIVYDLDGTLLDTAATILDIINIYRGELKKERIEITKLIPWLSLGGEIMMKKTLEIEDREALYYLKLFREEYYNIQTSIKTVYPEVEDTLKQLSKDYYLSICTNKPRILAEKVLTETNLINFFSFISAGDDWMTKKPHPDNLINCLKYFSVASNETILVGDSKVDQKLAKACLVDFIHFIPGYDDGVQKNINKSISKHSELLGWLRKYGA